MTIGGPTAPPPPSLHRRALLLLAVLLGLVAGLPWVLDQMEEVWFPIHMVHLREYVQSGITLLLGAWVLILVHREQQATRRHFQELERLSVTDPLTGLGNRRAFERDLERNLNRSRRVGEPLALLYLDVDDLKRLNDRHGHAAGDETLRILASVLRSNSRMGCDTAYRVGGDEFVMVLGADRGGAEVIAGRIALAFPERSPWASRVSMGVVVWDGRANVAELLQEADSRMYRQKHEPVYQWA